jgi:endonuclease/exonuclease/phosphatase family metal-dependent hydrolase
VVAVGVVLSWNVAGRIGAIQEAQILALAKRTFDVLCLQEVTPSTRSRWEEALAGQGLHVAVSEWSETPRGSRRFAVLIASCTPVQPLTPLSLPWPERHLAARTSIDGAEVEVHTLHAPLSNKLDQVKVLTLETVYSAVARDRKPARIVAGDLNTPRYESREGEVTTFARTATGALRPELGERHDRAELALIQGLPRLGWCDAFRSLHGYARRDRSWRSRGRSGYRLDHILVSPQLRPSACEYLHHLREDGLSDHAAIWAELAP